MYKRIDISIVLPSGVFGEDENESLDVQNAIIKHVEAAFPGSPYRLKATTSDHVEPPPMNDGA